MAKVTGIVFIKVDGALQRSEEGASLELGGFEREARTGHSVYGPSEKVVASVITFTTAHVGGDDIIDLQNKTEATLEFETDTGDTCMIRNAFSTKPAKLTGDGGGAEFEFMGDPAVLA